MGVYNGYITIVPLENCNFLFFIFYFRRVSQSTIQYVPSCALIISPSCALIVSPSCWTVETCLVVVRWDGSGTSAVDTRVIARCMANTDTVAEY